MVDGQKNQAKISYTIQSNRTISRQSSPFIKEKITLHTLQAGYRAISSAMKHQNVTERDKT